MLEASHKQDWYCNEESGFCYTISDDRMNVHAAKTYCTQFHQSNLVSILTADENVYVGRLCGFQSCWIGLVEDHYDHWSWLDGSSFD